MFHHRPTVILNPVSAGGRTRRNQETIVQAIHTRINDEFDLKITRAPQDGTILTVEAVTNGSELIIAIGGDGTIQEVVNGLLAKDKDRYCRLGIISSGTGHGFAQSLGLPNSLDEQLDVALYGFPRKVDVGKVTFLDHGGICGTRYFINECQLGIGGEVVQRVQRNHKQLGGKLGFGLGTIETALCHPNQTITYEVDGATTISTSVTGIVIANGAFTGGGMNLAPAACVDDGWLNLLLMQEMSVAERLYSFPKIYSGKHIQREKFKYQKMHSIAVDSPEKVLVEADGELFGTTPCAIEIVPASIVVQCGLERN
jgi:diacylglycerol kinase (ATP)